MYTKYCNPRCACVPMINYSTFTCRKRASSQWHMYRYMYTCICDEKEERKKQARSNKQQGMYMYSDLYKCTLYMCRTAHVQLWKSDCLGCIVLLCFIVCTTLLAYFFLHSTSLINMYSFYTCTYTVHTVGVKKSSRFRSVPFFFPFQLFRSVPFRSVPF